MSPQDAKALDEQGRGLRRLARALVGDAAAADDAVQEAYVLALQRERVGAVAWLRGVVKNKIRERRRGDSRRRAREQSAAPSAAPSTPTDMSAAIDEQRRVMTALGRVPEPFRTAVWMRHIAGHDTQSTAEALGIPPATVRTRVHRGLEHLREQLDAEHGGNRKTWQALLVPLLWEEPPVPVAPPLPTANVGTTLAAAAVLAAGLIAGISLLDRGGDEPPPIPAPDSSTTRTATVPTLAGRASDLIAADSAATTTDTVVLRGHVRPADGRLPDALQVYVIAKEAQFHTRPVARTEPDADGRFELDVPSAAGHWVAAISADGRQYGAVDGDAWSAEQPLVVPLVLPPERSVRVFDRRGVLIPRQLVWFLPVGDGLRRTWPRPQDDRFTTFTASTDERGELLVRVPAHGAFRVRVRDRLPVAERVVPPGAGGVDLHLSAGGAVRLELAGWTRGMPDFRGVLENLEDPGAAAPTGSFVAGTLSFENVPPGRWRVHAEAAGYRTTSSEIVVVTDAEASVLASTGIRRRHDLGSLELELFDPEGHLLPSGRFWNSGTWLRAHAANTPEWTTRHPDDHDANRLSFRALEAGTYDLFMAKHVAGRLLSSARASVQVVAGQESRIRIDFRDAHWRRMPTLGAFDVAHRRLVHAELGELPILSDWTGRKHPIGGLPLEGSEIGPYPEGAITLELWDPRGRQKVVSLSP